MTEKETKDFLLKILYDINYWVDYAEKKSSYILTLFTILSGLIVFIIDKFKNNYVIIFGSFLFFLFYLISLLLMLNSLTPTTNKSIKLKTKNITNKDNLIYFGDIAKYDNDSYRNILLNK